MAHAARLVSDFFTDPNVAGDAFEKDSTSLVIRRRYLDIGVVYGFSTQPES